jgi:hypothetical protein
MAMSAPEGPTVYTTNRCEHRHRSIGAAVRCALQGRADQGWHVLRADGTGLTRDEERQVGEHLWRHRCTDRTGVASRRAPAGQRELGFLDGEVTIEFADGFEMTEEEFSER